MEFVKNLWIWQKDESIPKIKIPPQKVPVDFNIKLTEEELEKINKLLQIKNQNIFSKKTKELETRFTILKSKNSEYFMIGDGIDKKNLTKNAFLGSGSFGRVKVCLKLSREKNNLQLTNSLFAVKIFKNPEISDFKKFNNESYFYKKRYGFGELIADKTTSKTHKAYLIIPLIPGTSISNINLTDYNKKEFVDLIFSSVESIKDLHKNHIIHGDLDINNILYDKKTNAAYLIDFESSYELNTNNTYNTIKKEKLISSDCRQEFKFFNSCIIKSLVSNFIISNISKNIDIDNYFNNNTHLKYKYLKFIENFYENFIEYTHLQYEYYNEHAISPINLLYENNINLKNLKDKMNLTIDKILANSVAFFFKENIDEKYFKPPPVEILTTYFNKNSSEIEDILKTISSHSLISADPNSSFSSCR